MPRDGSGVYSQPFPDVVTDTTIASPVYNGFVHDVALDLNTPRPVVAGGTGANNASAAMFNLKGESTDQVVNNYASFNFLPGSFYSPNVSGIGAPVDGHAFAGIAYLNEPLASPPSNQNLVIEVVDQNDTTQPGTKWIRQKTGGVWSAWSIVNRAGQDARYVLKAGDTMTGPLVLPADPTAPLQASTMQYVDNKAATVAPVMDGVAAVGASALYARQDHRHPTDTTLLPIAGGTITGNLLITGYAGVGSGGAAGRVYFGNPVNAKYLDFNGTDFSLTGGANSGLGGNWSVGGTFSVAGNVSFGGATNNVTGNTTFGGNVQINGGCFIAGSSTVGANLGVLGTLLINYPTIGDFYLARNLSTNDRILQFGAGIQIGWYASGAQLTYISAGFGASLTVDNGGNLFVANQGYKPGGGAWAATSDERTKNIQGPYSHGLAEVLQLAPIVYTNKGNTSFASNDDEHVKLGKDTTTPYVGLSAQAAESVMPEMVTQRSAFIDGAPVDDLRVLDNSALVYALVNAVKELASRVAALEGAR